MAGRQRLLALLIFEWIQRLGPDRLVQGLSLSLGAKPEPPLAVSALCIRQQVRRSQLDAYGNKRAATKSTIS